MRDTSHASPRADLFTGAAIDPLLVPRAGSPRRTDALVRTHLEICLADLRGEAIAPAEHSAAQDVIREKQAEFRKLLWDHSIAPDHCPSRIFLHSEALVRGDSLSRRYVNFLAEVRNPRGDFLVLSEHGWSTHAAGPAFSHVHVSLTKPAAFFSCKLYSLDAFREEAFLIQHHGVRSLLGFKPRSYILEESCSAIARLCGVGSCEASGIQRIDLLERGPLGLTLLMGFAGLGTFRVRAELVPNRWFVSCTAVAARG